MVPDLSSTSPGSAALSDFYRQHGPVMRSCPHALTRTGRYNGEGRGGGVGPCRVARSSHPFDTGWDSTALADRSERLPCAMRGEKSPQPVRKRTAMGPRGARFPVGLHEKTRTRTKKISVRPINKRMSIVRPELAECVSYCETAFLGTPYLSTLGHLAHRCVNVRE